MKAHIGVDVESGLVHTVTTTAANAADVTQTEHLLHGSEVAVYADAGFTVGGLAGEAETDVAGFPGIDGPVLLVVGSEGEGLARLVRENCDVLVNIPISSAVESLNASVAAAVALYEISRSRA